MFGIDLEKEVGEIFKDIIKEYHFVLVPFDDSEVFLIKRDFAISINVTYDGIIPIYLTKNAQGEYVDYWFGIFIGEKFDDEDRAIAKHEDMSTLINDYRVQLKILALGLKRHWSNILEGDKDWIQNYLGPGYDEGTLNAPTLDFVKKYF